MDFSILSLVITDRCTAACDFCGFSCSPENKQAMPADWMSRVIPEAKSLGCVHAGFSGGEPYLYPELLSEGIRMAREAGMSVTVATNGFWGKWEDDRIREMLEKARPDMMCFSYDSFHQRFIPEEQFYRAVSSCISLNIKFTVSVADLKGEHGAGRFIHSLGQQKYGMEFNIYPLYRMGRAKNMPPEWFFTTEDREKLCCVYDHALSVLPNGDVYPCCRYEVLGTPMKLGNIRDGTIREMLDGSDVPMICDVLMKADRFLRLLEIAEDKGIPVPRETGCACEYCRVLFGTEENKRLMLPCVEELYGEMKVRSLLKEAADDIR